MSILDHIRRLLLFPLLAAILVGRDPGASASSAQMRAMAGAWSSRPCGTTAGSLSSSSTADQARQVAGMHSQPTVGQAMQPVHYASMPAQAFRVLVDQPSGTIFALSDDGNLLNGNYADYLNSGSLTILDGATAMPPSWVPASHAGTLQGMVVPLADEQGRLYFSCGDGLYQVQPNGLPQRTALQNLPLSAHSDVPVTVDEPAHRLFILAGDAVHAFDIRTGRSAGSSAPLPTVSNTGITLLAGPLAVDARGHRVYIAEYGFTDEFTVGSVPSNLHVLTLQAHLVGTLPALGSGVGTAQLIVAGTARRMVVFGCDFGTGGAVRDEFAQVLDLSTGHYLTRKPLLAGACGGPLTGSLLQGDTPGILAVDAAAGTAVVVSSTWARLNPPAPPNPGFAWFINLRTGGWFNTGTSYGCVQVGRQPSAVAIDSRLHRAYVASSADGLVTILDTRTGHVLGVVHVGGAPTSIAVDTHDQQVVVALDGVPGPTQPGGLAFFPAGITTAQVPPTRGCAAEGAPFFLALPGIRTTVKG